MNRLRYRWCALIILTGSFSVHCKPDGTISSENKQIVHSKDQIYRCRLMDIIASITVGIVGSIGSQRMLSVLFLSDVDKPLVSSTFPVLRNRDLNFFVALLSLVGSDTIIRQAPYPGLATTIAIVNTSLCSAWYWWPDDFKAVVKFLTEGFEYSRSKSQD